MKKLFLLFALSTIIFSCDNKSKDSYTVTGNIEGLQSSVVYLSYEKDGEYSTDSTTANGGQFTFEGEIREPALAYLQTSDGFGTTIVLENTKIQVDGNLDDADNVKVTGGKVQEEYHDFLQSQAELRGEQDAIYNKATEAKDSGDDEVFNEQMDKAEEFSSKILAANKAYIEQHPKSYVSLFLLNDLSESLSLEDVEDLYSTIDKSYQNSVLGQKIADRIETIKKTSVGATAMDFTQNDLTGKAVKLSDFKGKYVLLDFWASWCVPCRAENPNVLNAYNKYKDKNFTVLAVSLDMKDSDWREAIEEDGMPWTQLSDLKGGENEVAKMYGIFGIPANFLIDPNGVIIAKNLRGEELQTKLAEALN